MKPMLDLTPLYLHVREEATMDHFHFLQELKELAKLTQHIILWSDFEKQFEVVLRDCQTW